MGSDWLWLDQPCKHRPFADLSDDELEAGLRRALVGLPDPASMAELWRVDELRAAYAARYGRLACPDPAGEQTTRVEGPGKPRPGSQTAGWGAVPMTAPAPNPSTNAVAAEPQRTYRVPSDGRPAGGGDVPSLRPERGFRPPPPATYDPDGPVSVWWADEPDPRVPLRHIAVWSAVSLLLWALAIVVCVWAAGGLR